MHTVYASEKADGLTEAIQKSNTLAYVSPLVIVDTAKRPMPLVDLFQAVANNQNQFDLLYLDTILTTVGWNKNDDVFDRYETWEARKTAEDKPFNLEHNPRTIIGHMTGSKAVDEEYKVIDDSTLPENLPETFHILANSVIYKHLKSKDEDLEKTTATMIEEIQNGDWYVSMEALFKNFNYAVITASNEQRIIPRTEETAFLTKHLRCYGGKGIYDGHKIGRAMSGLVFSGKGLVKKPANDGSIIFASQTINRFNGTSGTIQDLTQKEVIFTMATEQELLATVAELKARLKGMDEEKVQASINELKTAVATTKELAVAKVQELTETQAALTATKSELATANATIEALKVDVTKAAEVKQTLEGELSTLKTEATKATRKADLIEKGVEAAKAEELVTTFASFTDEQFTSVAQLAIEAATAAAGKKKDDEAATDDKMKKGNGLKGNKAQPGSVSAGDETDGAQDVVTAEEIAAAKAAEEAALTTAAEGTEANTELMQSIASYIGSYRGKPKENEK